jgi:uncharacterized membrane protein YecN with MAPEG domain
MVVYLYAAFLTAMLLALTYNVIWRRRRLRIGLGSGGNDGLDRAIRAHSSFVEFVPFTLLLIYMVEDAGAALWTIHLMGWTLVIGRLLHVWGLSGESGHSFGRMAGSVLTHLVLAGAALFCIWLYYNAPNAD